MAHGPPISAIEMDEEEEGEESSEQEVRAGNMAFNKSHFLFLFLICKMTVSLLAKALLQPTHSGFLISGSDPGLYPMPSIGNEESAWS